MNPFYTEILLKHKHDIIVVGFIFYGKTEMIFICKRKLSIYKKLVQNSEMKKFVTEYLQSLQITYKTLTFKKIAKMSVYGTNVIDLTFPVSLQEVDKTEQEMIEKLYERYL